MRLVCPNCGAQYEVDERVIPDSGRDVQCSACGHAWYQRPAGHPEDHDPEPAPPAEEDVAAGKDEIEPEELDSDEPEPRATPTPGADEIAAVAQKVAPAPRRPVDTGVRDILKEEAERELEARSRERPHDPGQVETQPDLGIETPPDPDEERRRRAREKMARMRGLDPEDVSEEIKEAEEEAAEDPKGVRAARRDRFPDIEEINSTLESHEAAERGGLPDEEKRQRSGFGSGFTLVIVLVGLALMAYILAPQISDKLPSTAPVMAAYVDAVDQARAWLQDNVQILIEKIEAMAAPEA